ncbi:MAG: DUF445 domain-containing protein, partial [Acidimicrobiia bacterium]
VVIAGLYLAAVLAGGDEVWLGYARAALEGSLVGGLADWFAVTAIFRHPLGIPIPHTAIIRERKDQFGETLGAFVQENFLSPDVVGERVRAAAVPQRLAAWLSVEENAATVASYAGDAVVGLADVVRDEDVHRVLQEELERAVERIPLATLSARTLRFATAEGRHQELLDTALRGLEKFLLDNREPLRQRFGHESPWWLPEAVEDRIFDRLLGGVTNLLHAVNEDPQHELRAEFDERVAAFIDRLEHAPEMQERAEQLKHDFLAHPELRRWSSSLWVDIKETLKAQAADPESRLRVRLTSGVCALGHRLERDPVLLAKGEELVEAAVRYVAEHFRDEIAGLVSGTVSRWDPEETSNKLELLLGRDLQFIRINGTIVGGLAGLVIHLIGTTAG